MDIMMAEADLDISAPSRIAPRIRGDLEAMQHAADILAQAQHPLIIVGDEVAKTDALDELVAVAEALGAPVFAETVPTPPASRAIIPCTRALWRGRNAGPRSVLQDADVVFTVGADMFTMSLYTDIDPFPPGVTWVSLHVDPWEIAKNRPVEVGILGDPKATLAEFLPMLRSRLDSASNRQRGSAPKSSVAPRRRRCNAWPSAPRRRRSGNRCQRW